MQRNPKPSRHSENSLGKKPLPQYSISRKIRGLSFTGVNHRNSKFRLQLESDSLYHRLNKRFYSITRRNFKLVEEKARSEQRILE